MNLNDPTTVALLAAEAFETAGCAYALYGGLLTAAYGDPRETRDADLAVVDVSVQRASEALGAVGLPTLVAFEDVTFGGVTVSRLTVVSQAPHTGLNTIDLVRPRSTRYAALAVERAAGAPLRGRAIRVLTLEDFIVFKVLSTRERDLEDARAAIRRSRPVLDDDLLEREIARLSHELPDVDVQGRWRATRG